MTRPLAGPARSTTFTSLLAAFLFLTLGAAAAQAQQDVAANEAAPTVQPTPMDLPKCAPHEGLCPVKRGSNELRVRRVHAAFGRFQADATTAVRRLYGPKDVRWMRLRRRRSRLHECEGCLHASMYQAWSMLWLPVRMLPQTGRKDV